MVKEHLLRNYHYPAANIRVLHNAIDPLRLDETDRLRLRAEIRDTCGIPHHAPVGLMVAHNYRLKGLDPLLLAVRELSRDLGFHLLVCGSSRTSGYERMIRRLGIKSQVHLIGFQPNVRACFFAADFLIHPTFYDPCSLVVLEALTCGLPVITTQYNGAAELLHEGRDGYIIPNPHDYRLLARRIQQLCKQEKCLALSQEARNSGRAWTFEDHYQALVQVFQQAARRNAAA
jgi:UDP-glucose:(heptosyl)LPS alpha-1,3-glucosyltransferase